MARPWPLALTLISSLLFLGPSKSEYVRPPPGRIITLKSNKPKTHPQQVHVSSVGAQYMRVSWITEDKHAPSVVEYGKVSGVYQWSATGEQTKYHYFFYSSGLIHHVKVGPLEANTIYFYRCSRAGDEYSFKTPPASLPVEFAIIGDLGQSECTASTLAHVGSSDYDMLLLPGDLSYADRQQPLWDSFGLFVERYASQRPWMVTEGNHEIESFSILTKPFKAYNARWRMAYEESGSPSNLYYSFDVAGSVHVVMLGSYTDFDCNSHQYKWLVSDLNKVDRKRTPWLIALLHAPWYNTNSAHQGKGESMRKAMESLLYESHVDLVFAGHVHAYERSTRIYDNEADPCGPMYITIGDGGNREGLASDFKENHKSRSLSLFREASFGHGRLKVLNGTSAHWSWHRNEDSNSSVGDELWIESLSSTDACKPRKNSIHSSAKDEL